MEMHTLKCKSVEELVEVAVETYELLEEDKQYMSFVARYENAKEILKELVFYGYDVCSIDLESPDWSDYVDEFDITVINDTIYCEKAKSKDGYYNSSAYLVFFDADANSRCIKSYESTMKYEFQIGDEDQDDVEQLSCEHKKCDKHECKMQEKDEIPTVNFDQDGKGFRYEKSDANGYQAISYRSSEHVDRDDLADILRKFYF